MDREPRWLDLRTPGRPGVRPRLVRAREKQHVVAIVALLAAAIVLAACSTGTTSTTASRRPTPAPAAGRTAAAVRRQLASPRAAVRQAGVRGAARLLGLPLVDGAGVPIGARNGADAPAGKAVVRGRAVVYDAEVPELARMATVELGPAETLASLLQRWGLRGSTTTVARLLRSPSGRCGGATGRPCRGSSSAAALVGPRDRFTLLDAWMWTVDADFLAGAPGAGLGIATGSPLADPRSEASHALVLANLPRIRMQAPARPLRQGVAGGGGTRVLDGFASMPTSFPGHITGGPLAGTRVRRGRLDGAIVRWAIDGTTWGSSLRGVDASASAAAGAVDGATTPRGNVEVRFDAGTTGGVARGDVAKVPVSLTVLASRLAPVGFADLPASLAALLADAPSATETVLVPVCCPIAPPTPTGPPGAAFTGDGVAAATAQVATATGRGAHGAAHLELPARGVGGSWSMRIDVPVTLVASAGRRAGNGVVAIDAGGVPRRSGGRVVLDGVARLQLSGPGRTAAATVPISGTATFRPGACPRVVQLALAVGGSVGGERVVAQLRSQLRERSGDC